MLTINDQKKTVRALVKQLKAGFTDDEKAAQSESIFNLVEQLVEFKQANTIFAYWSLPDEVNTHNFINKWHGKKKIILPLVNGDSLELREYDETQGLERGTSFGIMEPQKGKIVNLEDIDIAIIPGLAFDQKKRQ